MQHLDARIMCAEATGDLEQAAGIARRHDPCARLEDARDFEVEEPACHRGLEHVVDTGAAAAQITVSQLDEREAWDATEQLARLSANPLTVRKVTGIVVGHRRVEAPQWQ